MFQLPKHKVLVKGYHQIVENKFVLYSDGDNNLMYTGNNAYGNRLLSSIMAEDDENNILRYYHILLQDKEYHNFLNRKITLRQILTEVENFFVVDFKYDGTEVFSTVASIEDIPEEYLPLDNSYCPDFIFESSFHYTASLKGKQSDQHKVLVPDMTEVTNSFYRFLLSPMGLIDDLVPLGIYNE